MAEINIQKKKKPILPWILLIILIAIIVWVAISFYNSSGTEVVIDDRLEDSTSTNYGMMNDSIANQKVNQFIVFINDTSLIKTDNEKYLAGGIERLHVSLLSISNDNSDKVLMDSSKQLNKKIQQDSSRQNKSRLAKSFFINAAYWMDSLSQNNSQNAKMNIQKLKESTQKIDEKESIDSQMDKMQKNFALSGNVLLLLVKDDRTDRKNYDNY